MLIPALMLSASLMADNEKYEVTPVIGYNFVENNLALDDAMLYGAEVQYNGYDSVFKPELSVLYSNPDYDNSNLDADIYRLALNAVYEYDKVGVFTPLAKLGLGYETISGTHNTQNSDGAFLDAGVGAKVELAKNLALKLEAIYMLKDGVKGSDNNLATLVGLSYAFGGTTPAPAPEPIAEPVAKPAPQPIDGDDDNDGVLNSVDSCPTTPAGNEVDAKGCCLDDDKDGVINSTDKCLTTPAGQVVDADGCMLKVDLHINFNTNSYSVDAQSDTNIADFAHFLKLQPEYSAKITGHTDSRGKASYNKTLSQKRAEAVKALLVEKGVAEDRIASDGMGEESPVADNSSKEGRAENRRIEASLVKN